MSLYDILGTPNNDEISSPSFENMDVSLDYNSTDLMTSDFFDSVLSLSEGNLENGLDNEILSNFDDDVNILSESSSHTDEVFSPRSITSDSEKSSIQNESSDEYVSSNFSRFEAVDENLLMSLLEPTENVKVFEANSTTFMGNKSRPTKIVIQNPNNKKIIVTKPIIHSSQLKELSPKMKKILKVQTINGSGKSVLLPFNVKSIKILNASDIKTEGIRVSSSVIDSTVAQCKIEPASPSSIDDDDVDVVSSTDNQYPALHLTNEEKRLLSKEGIQLPTHYPLTKNEERELKRIRRKIRNKISAQDSRKRKKEYVDGLEERVQRSSEEKKYLLQRIKQLQRQNNKLMSHFSKLQSLLFKSSQSKATPSTCVMIVLLSALLVSLPNIRLPQRQLNEVEQGARRALLSSNLDEDIHMDEFLVFKDDAEHQSEMDGENITEKELSNMFEDADKGWHEKESMFDKMLENLGSWLKPTTSSSKRVFIEPDIDDDPPMKRTCFDLNVMSDVQPAPDPQIPLITTTTIGLQNSKDK